MKGKRLSYTLIIIIIVFTIAILPIAIDLSENLSYFSETNYTDLVIKKINTNSSTVIVAIDFESSGALKENPARFNIAIMGINAYNQWVSNGGNTSQIQKEYLLAESVTSAEITRTYKSENAFVLIIWSVDGSKGQINLDVVIIPADDIQVLAVLGGFITFSVLLLILVVIINIVLFFAYPDRRKKEPASVSTQVSKETKTTFVQEESARVVQPENYQRKVDTSRTTTKIPQRSFLEQLDETIQLFTERELLLLSISGVIFFTSLFGSAFVPGDVGNFIRGFGMMAGLLMGGVFGIHFLLRRKKKQELINYLELKRRAKIEELVKIFGLDVLSLQQLILEINREAPGTIRIIGDFEEISLGSAGETTTSVVGTAQLTSETTKEVATSEFVCPFCGAKNDKNAVFCSQCGASLIPPK